MVLTAGRVRLSAGDVLFVSGLLVGGGGKRCNCGTLLLESGQCIDCNPPQFIAGGSSAAAATPDAPRRSALDDSDAEDIPVGWGEEEFIRVGLRRVRRFCRALAGIGIRD